MIKNLNQKRILFAEDGIDRWNASLVARAILRRVARQDLIRINKFDVEVINRMARVLGTGKRISDPFAGSLANELSSLEVQTSDILAVFD